MRYVFHPEALAEYAEAVQYYNAKQRAEVAQGFINAVEYAVCRIRESPERYVVIDEDARKCITRKMSGVLTLAANSNTYRQQFYELTMTSQTMQEN